MKQMVDAMPGVLAYAVQRTVFQHIKPPESDWLAQEKPVAFEVNGLSHAVMMASPIDLEDFAWGFAYSEGLIDSSCDLIDLDIDHTDEQAVIALQVSGRLESQFRQRRKAMAGATGCGLCGVQSVHTALQIRPAPIASATLPRLFVAEVQTAFNFLIAEQPLLAASGATHAAAWVNPANGCGFVREDVGRHNALDKVIGAALRNKQALGQGLLLTTSRASFELVHKTIRAGIQMLAVVSAPTSLAVQMAQENGITLVGFKRDNRFNVYSHAQRLIGQGDE
jgi:FdhD protein